MSFYKGAFIAVVFLVLFAFASGCTSSSPSSATPVQTSSVPQDTGVADANAFVMASISPVMVKPGEDIQINGLVDGYTSWVAILVTDNSGLDDFISFIDGDTDLSSLDKYLEAKGAPRSDGSFSYTMDTTDLTPGQYFIFITLPNDAYRKLSFMVE